MSSSGAFGRRSVDQRQQPRWRLLAFTLSIDDFVVTFFVKGPGADTLPVVIYSMIKKSREFPVINALSTLLLIATFLTVWASQRLTAEKT